MIAQGIMGLIVNDFGPVWDPVPTSFPACELLVYLTAFISLASGIGLLWRRTAAPAARLLFASLLLWFLIFRVPDIVRSPTFSVFWPFCKTAAMLAGAWVLYIRFADGWDKQRLNFASGNMALSIARVLFGLPVIFFGAAHFIDLRDTVVLMHPWLPWHVFWAYFFGCAFIAAGLAVCIGVFARLAAALTAFQIGLFLVVVWIPIVAAGSKDAFQWSETILTFALMSAAWVVADSYRGMKWLGAGKV